MLVNAIGGVAYHLMEEPNMVVRFFSSIDQLLLARFEALNGYEIPANIAVGVLGFLLIVFARSPREN